MSVFLGLQTPKTIFETESAYNGKIQVMEFGDVRRIIVDGFTQSLSPHAKSCNRLYWGKVIDVLKNEHPNPKNVLILGLGGGTLVHLISKNFPGVTLTSVDIDQTMVDIARNYFELDKVPNHNVIVDDALRFVIEPHKYGFQEYAFDVLIVDIYVGQKYPDLGKSGNFVSALKHLVVPGGLLIFNRIYREDHQDDVNLFIDQVSNFFSGVKNLIVAGYTNSDNVLIYGRNS